MAVLPSPTFSVPGSKRSVETIKICASLPQQWRIKNTHQRFFALVKKNPFSRTMASIEPLKRTQELDGNGLDTSVDLDNDVDLFAQLKHRFLRFKKQEFVRKSNHFRKLAEVQSPKFMVIACADSRVCPSTILGFLPGEAFTVRNVANLVPPFENGVSETKAALEFSVNSLEVENILIIGHSRCGGIKALMSMEDEEDDSSSFIRGWVTVGKNAKSNTKAVAANLSFDQQCRHCEKESINRSLLNLLTYPWIEERVGEGKLSLHGGYYDFVEGTFEKWTLENKGRMEEGCQYVIKDRAFWN